MVTQRNNRILELFGIELPVIQAPMAGATTSGMVIEASKAGGLGSLPCALLSVDQVQATLTQIRAATDKPINLNFFTHRDPGRNQAAQLAWQSTLADYYIEQGLDPKTPLPSGGPVPFDEAYCSLVETHRPAVVSFHFGLPNEALYGRVKRTGAKIIAAATTVAEARWLADHGVDAIIAMGLEAGGHRGNFLTDDMAAQVGTLALVPQVVDAVTVPVIAAGGIADPRGVQAAFALGASAVQVGTAYLLTPEANVTAFHRAALLEGRDDATALTNVLTGRPARSIINRLMREVGYLRDVAPAFPSAAGALVPLRAVAEKAGRPDFSGMWAGQAAGLAREMSTADLTRYLAGQ
jgi:nitronate monooxygenase